MTPSSTCLGIASRIRRWCGETRRPHRWVNSHSIHLGSIDPMDLPSTRGKSFPAGRPIIAASLELTERIHDDFRYDNAATHVNTSVNEAFQLRAGVCQDFAHVQIGCLRSIGIPARYVSGYLRTIPPEGRDRLVGSDESHAWISVYAGVDVGWIDMDPTNACMVGIDHIPICIGRDYGDVTPMRGVVLGGGQTTLSVKVDVSPRE